MDTFDDKVANISQQTHDENATIDQYAVSQTPFHTHNGADSPQLNAAFLTNRTLVVTVYLPGTDPQSSGAYGNIFIAPFKCIFTGAQEVHSVANGSDINVLITKCTGTTAPASGTNLLASGFNLNGVANTVVTGVLANTTKTTFSLNKGDRIGLSLGGGSLTSITNVQITLTLSF